MFLYWGNNWNITKIFVLVLRIIRPRGVERINQQHHSKRCNNIYIHSYIILLDAKLYLPLVTLCDHWEFECGRLLVPSQYTVAYCFFPQHNTWTVHFFNGGWRDVLTHSVRHRKEQCCNKRRTDTNQLNLNCTWTLGINLIQIPLHLLKGKVTSSVRSLPF